MLHDYNLIIVIKMSNLWMSFFGVMNILNIDFNFCDK
jgi:hypothetical protein